MRLFTAFDPPDALRDRIASFCDAAASDVPTDDVDVRWTSPATYHVTVRFIGDVDDAARYASALETVDVPAFTAHPYGLDVLPARRHPRVLVVGLDLTDGLRALYDAVSDALEGEGLEAESRRFRPHLTLARFQDADPEAVHHFLRAQSATFDPFEVNAIHLYQSTLHPDGAVHDRRRTYRLA